MKTIKNAAANNAASQANKPMCEAHATSDAKDLTNEKNLGIMVKNALSSKQMQKLALLSEFYCELILNNFIFSLNTEMFFLFQLLTLNSLEDSSHSRDDDKKMKIFTNLESCIYFAIQSICKLECMLKFLKSSTIIELQRNVYVKTFADLFPPDSMIINHSITKEELKTKSRMVFIELKQVPYSADVNARENFPMNSDTLFIAFKGQR